MNTKNLTDLLISRLLKDVGFREAFGVARKNSDGGLWLIGSGVYKMLLNGVFEEEFNIKDWDFIAERIIYPLSLESSWKVSETKHGNPKLKKDDLILDLVALDNIISIKERGLVPSISNYLSGTPLTIQSIAFDLIERKLIGDVGIKSIIDRTVGINDMAEYDRAIAIYGDKYSVDCYAEKLGLRKS